MYTGLYFEADARPPGGLFLAPVQLRRLDYDGVRKLGSATALDGFNCAVSGASSGRGEGRTIKDAPLARETVEHRGGRIDGKEQGKAQTGTQAYSEAPGPRANDGSVPGMQTAFSQRSE
jgi:hypothetical protein